MWYTAKRFCLVYTPTCIYALVYNRRHLLHSQRFPLLSKEDVSPLLGWLEEHKSPAMGGSLCIAHSACQTGKLVLPGHHDRYQCYLQLKPQVGFDDWFDFHLYYDRQGKQTYVYWYALPKADHHPLVAALEAQGFVVRGISTVALLLRYAGSQQLDREGVTFVYFDEQGIHFTVYQHRVLLGNMVHACDELNKDEMQIALQNVRQQIPLTTTTPLIACTSKMQSICQDLNVKAANMNTAWDESISGALPEYVCLAGGLTAREWYEFSA